jgi:hypothetical protein
MSYYRGDYYRGDYYKGDPYLGFILKGAARLGAGLVRTVAKRSVQAGRALIGSSAGRTAVGTAVGGGVIVAGEEIARQAGRRVFEETAGASPNYPEGTAGARPGGPVMVPMGAKGMCPPGFHPNKADGPKGAKGTYCVRNRRMNPLNPRALRRALRRSEDFEQIAKRTVNALRAGPRKFKKVSTMSR